MRPLSTIVSAVLPLILSACSTLAANPAPLSTVVTLPESKAEQGKALTELMSCDGGLRYIPVPAFQANDYTTVKLVSNTPTVNSPVF